MAVYVLVPGAWSGGWQWRAVAAHLRAAGDEVFTPTLTGLGERVHLAHSDIDLATHIQDIVNVIRFENLTDVILMGHSYGGMVITGVAECLPDNHAGHKIRAVIVVHDDDTVSGSAMVMTAA